MTLRAANPILDRAVQLFNRFLAFAFGYVTIHNNPHSASQERMFWLHWQNLCEDPEGHPRGFPWHGRAWLHWNREDKRPVALRCEWAFPRRSCRAKFELEGGENEIDWSFAFPPLALYFGLQGVLSYEWMRKHFRYEDREISINFHDWAVWWSFWRDGNSWSNKESKWRVGSFHFDRFFLGDINYSERLLSEYSVVIPMPEGNYPAQVKMTEDSWSRTRWFTKRILRAKVDMKTPIPFPGKGESSWDCGEDALFGICIPAKNVEEAIAKTAESAMRNRRRYGSGAMMRYPSPEAA